MPARFDHSRSIIHTALAALVMAALAHCSWEEGREQSQWVRTVSLHRLGMPTPLQTPVHDCTHESGCICRGATIILPADITPFQAQLAEILPVELHPISVVCDRNDLPANSLFAEQQPAPPPISGRQLRALYASLVI